MHIITLIRKYKTTPPDELLPIIQNYDETITTKSIHVALVALFKNNFEGLNNRRLYEVMRFINTTFSQLPSTQNVEAKFSGVRQIVKEKWGYNSLEYRKSQEHLVFDPIQKHKNIIEYNQKVFERNEKCKPIKVSLIKRLLAYKDSDDYRKQIVYLLINSGARYHELFTGVWTLDPDNKHNVLLSNIAKTSDK
jgi:hypothetical protein